MMTTTDIDNSWQRWEGGREGRRGRREGGRGRKVEGSEGVRE